MKYLLHKAALAFGLRGWAFGPKDSGIHFSLVMYKRKVE